LPERNSKENSETPQLPSVKINSPLQQKVKTFGFPFFFTFFLMFFTWIILSGKFDRFHLSLGVISCFLVAFFSNDFLLSSEQYQNLPRVWFRFIRYIPWLLYQIMVANIHIFYLVCHPRMMELLDPQIMEFKSRLKSDIARVTLANSITLTPGSITVYASIYGTIRFHVIDIKSGKTLPWVMDARVSEIFGE
jgi:multicomponent Na+:H+ antiporter subunit E